LPNSDWAAAFAISILLTSPVIFGLVLCSGSRYHRRLHAGELPPVWRVVQLLGVQHFGSFVFQCALFSSFIMQWAERGLRADGFLLVCLCVGPVILLGVAFEGMWFLATARKLRRLGYDQPPSAMA